MTLAQWLKQARKPECLGINARLQLKKYGAQRSHHRRIGRVMLDVAIGCGADTKHALYRTYAHETHFTIEASKP